MGLFGKRQGPEDLPNLFAQAIAKMHECHDEKSYGKAVEKVSEIVSTIRTTVVGEPGKEPSVDDVS